MEINTVFLGLNLLSLVIWTILLGFRGQFWRSDQRLKKPENTLKSYPSVCAVVPARNEAELLPVTLRSLLTQNYPGHFLTIVIDDRSTDGTACIAEEVAKELDCSEELKVITAQPLSAGWTGKLWAMKQGIDWVQQQNPIPEYILFTDADIQHESDNLLTLVTKAETEGYSLVSLMVLLRCENFWEKFLIPAFVFFFQKLYPFSWVNNPKQKTAAAAGGCILIRTQVLEQIGGIEAIRQALIDDCALANAVKSNPQIDSGIWLGLTTSARSLRPYPSLDTIWDMVARTAFTQLNYSLLLLFGTSIGMILTYLISPLSLVLGILTTNWLVAILGLITWLLMSLTYLPTIRLYGLSHAWSFSLPTIAFLYMLMTIDSAWRYFTGRGGSWKGRVYSIPGK